MEGTSVYEECEATNPMVRSSGIWEVARNLRMVGSWTARSLLLRRVHVKKICELTRTIKSRIFKLKKPDGV